MPVIRDHSKPVKRKPKPKKAPARTAGRNPNRGPAPVRHTPPKPKGATAPRRTAPNQVGPAPTRDAIRRAFEPKRTAPRRDVETRSAAERSRRVKQKAKAEAKRRRHQPYGRGIAPTFDQVRRTGRLLEAPGLGAPAIRRVAPTFRGMKENTAAVRRARQAVLSRGQFRRIEPFGDYNAYLDYVAETRNVDVGDIVRLAAPLKASRVKQLAARAATRQEAELGRVIAKLDNEIPVALDLLSEFRDMPPETRAKMAQLVELANEYAGTPYVWGAPFDRSSARTLQGRQTGFDCSGFIDALYRATYGISPGGSTHTQRYAGRPIEVGSDYQPGDLVFWHEDRGHVGLYIGDGWFMHAPQTGDVVRISNLSDRETPVQVNRIVG